jgi:hypothetical protein
MMSSESDNNDEDDANSQYDEVQQIKIAMVSRVNPAACIKTSAVFLSTVNI